MLINQRVKYSIFARCIEWLLPARCPLTGEAVERQGMIASSAWAQLHFVADPICRQCGIPLGFSGAETPSTGAEITCVDCLQNPPSFAGARSVLVYDDASRPLILGFKHADQTYAVRTFVPWLLRAGADYLRDDPLIVPVPLHRWRLLRRRYNQAALLAHGVARESGQSCIPDLLLRTRATPTQGHMKAGERARNVSRAFGINPRHADKVRGRKILLIDDVLTTGATVRECSDTLLQAGASAVNILTIARTVRN